MPTRIVLADGAYVLQESAGESWVDLAVLPGGAGALLPQGRSVDEGRLEMAIELAEDWLMPHATRLRGEILQVSDPTGRLRSGMTHVLSSDADAWNLAEVETLFLRVVDLATGRMPSAALQGHRAFIADLLVLRELAHHGQVLGIARS